MKKSIFILVALAVMLAVAMPVLAASPGNTTSGAIYSVPGNQAFEDYLNSGSFPIKETHRLDKEKKFTKGIGLNTLLIETEIVDVVSESKFNLDTHEGTFFLVGETKKPLLNVIVGWFK